MPTLLPPDAPDWSAEELVEIERLKAACAASPCWHMECSHTDEGDPWCIVFHRRHHQMVLVHLARIGRRYVSVWAMEGRSTTTTNLRRSMRPSRRSLLNSNEQTLSPMAQQTDPSRDKPAAGWRPWRPRLRTVVWFAGAVSGMVPTLAASATMWSINWLSNPQPCMGIQGGLAGPVISSQYPVCALGGVQVSICLGTTKNAGAEPGMRAGPSR